VLSSGALKAVKMERYTQLEEEEEGEGLEPWWWEKLTSTFPTPSPTCIMPFRGLCMKETTKWSRK
jgi:hypothetical protein